MRRKFKVSDNMRLPMNLGLLFHELPKGSM